MPQATKLVLSKLGITQVLATPYHPQTNGTCEMFNGTLKSMLGKVTYNNPSNWDTIYIKITCLHILFAFREVPQASTKFSPFELVYGANPWGPLCLYKELLTSPDLSVENKLAYDLVTNVRERILRACELANRFIELVYEKSRNYKNVNKKTDF